MCWSVISRTRLVVGGTWSRVGCCRLSGSRSTHVGSTSLRLRSNAVTYLYKINNCVYCRFRRDCLPESPLSRFAVFVYTSSAFHSIRTSYP